MVLNFFKGLFRFTVFTSRTPFTFTYRGTPSSQKSLQYWRLPSGSLRTVSECVSRRSRTHTCRIPPDQTVPVVHNPETHLLRPTCTPPPFLRRPSLPGRPPRPSLGSVQLPFPTHDLLPDHDDTIVLLDPLSVVPSFRPTYRSWTPSSGPDSIVPSPTIVTPALRDRSESSVRTKGITEGPVVTYGPRTRNPSSPNFVVVGEEKR